jgi:tRNA-splicing ligase RtcB
MRVPVRLFADDHLLDDALDDARHPGRECRHAAGPGQPRHRHAGCPSGYSFPIGGVAATRLPDGVISPGAIGYDINCGVRLLASELSLQEAESQLPRLADALYASCPSGVGVKGSVPLKDRELDRVCRDGARWAEQQGFAAEGDLLATEEAGRLDGGEVGAVSARARERGRPQLGTLGAGNHFVEVDVVDKVFHPEAAQAMGLAEGRLTLQIHCGSRGFGHQICSDYVDELQTAVRRYGIELPDRELVCAPLNSPEGLRYLSAMACAANYAFANRQILAHHARRAFSQVFGEHPTGWLTQIYDIAHNMGKIEEHVVEGERVRVCVHRKGATRAFGPGFEGLPPRYRALGQPVLVPGSMGTASWVLLGTAGSMALAFGSTCHGAGRRMSRHQAKRSIRGDRLRAELEERGIQVRAGSLPGLAEEAPHAYKDVDAVVAVVTGRDRAKVAACARSRWSGIVAGGGAGAVSSRGQ